MGNRKSVCTPMIIARFTRTIASAASTDEPCSATSKRSNLMPHSCAIAGRCSAALVEPPEAATTVAAFSSVAGFSKAVSRFACHRSTNLAQSLCTAPAERSGDGAFAGPAQLRRCECGSHARKAAWRCASRRSQRRCGLSKSVEQFMALGLVREDNASVAGSQLLSGSRCFTYPSVCAKNRCSNSA